MPGTMNAEISLDGEWEFLYAADGSPIGPAEVRPIQVPGPWQAQFPDLRTRAGIGIYRRQVDIPAGWRVGRIVLRFGAVFHVTRVWVNAVPVGSHEGGFLPFAFDVTEQLVEGPNEITVRVESPTDNPHAFPDAPFAEIPFGKQSWYGPLSGIWQSVSLQRRSPDHLSRVRIQPDWSSGRVRTTLFPDRALSQAAEASIVIRDPDGETVAASVSHLAAGTEEQAALLEVAQVRSWSPDSPALYALEVTLARQGEIVDRRVETFGFRSIEARDGRLYLNGEPLYLRAALDQDYYPDGICTVPSVKFLEDQFRKAKQLGLNALRLHIKAPDPRYYEVADRIGLLVWTELPNGGLSTERSRNRKERLLKGIVDRDGNHPSIIIWTIINENWGVDLVHDADHRAWLKRTYWWLKAYDPSRLVVDNSPLAPSFHVETDIADYHFYAAFPDNRRAWDGFVADLASRPSWLFSPEGDAVVTGTEPLMCSEFGNWGLPDPRDLHDGQGREPWWFETGHDWGEGVMYAHGIENRFRDWSLDRAFGTLQGFIAAAQWQQYRALKYEIERMREQPSLAGYVITEFCDAHWESNGLLDMRRNPRVFHDSFAAINADTVVVPRWDRLALWSGEEAALGLSVAHGAGAPIEGATLHLDLPGAEPIRVPRLEAGQVVDLGPRTIRLEQSRRPELRRIALVLRSADGGVIARNHLDVAVHPALDRRILSGLRLWSPEEDVLGYLEGLGYAVASGATTADLVVTTRHDDAIAAHVRQGGRLLHLPAGEELLYPFFPHWQNVKVVQRAGTLWAGDWASTFAWLRRAGPFEALPGGPMIDETFDRVIPTHVIANCNLLDFQGRVHGGLVIGWVHKPVALVVERSYGKGRFVASTFRLMRDAPGADPTATLLMEGLLRLALGDGRESATAGSRSEEAA
jgi:hypothetical protein